MLFEFALIDSVPNCPIKGEFVGGEVPLTPLKNVGRAILKIENTYDSSGSPTEDETLRDLVFVRRAYMALFDAEFFETNVLMTKSPEVRSVVQRRPRNLRKAGYGQHVKTLIDAQVIRSLTTGATMYANYFAVLKDVIDGLKFARAIFDARPFNEICKRPPKFDLCSMDRLLSILSNFGTKALYFFSADLVNMYYQIPIAQHLAVFMALMCDQVTYIPTVMPMGWSWACFVAQALCWGIILRCLPRDEDLAIPDDIDTLEAAPGHVEMKDGTVILCIYDTILVIAASQERAAQWGARIERNMARAGCELKYAKYERRADFAGIRISSTPDGTTWELLKDSQQQWLNWAKMTPQTPPTAQKLWKALGFLRSAAPVVGLEISKIGRLVHAQSTFARQMQQMTKRDYLADRPGLAEPINAALDLISRIEFAPRHPKSHLSGMKRIFRAAVDATTRHECCCFFDDDRPKVPYVRKTKAKDILGGEANALAWAVKIWSRDPSRQEGDVLVVVGDNQPVMRSFWRGWSTHDEIDEAIREVIDELDRFLVILADVESAGNYADIGSRPDEDFSDEEILLRRKKTIERAEQAVKHFRKTRSRVCMRYETELELEDNKVILDVIYEDVEPQQWVKRRRE